jgi:hypothetical protein
MITYTKLREFPDENTPEIDNRPLVRAKYGIRTVTVAADPRCGEQGLHEAIRASLSIEGCIYELSNVCLRRHGPRARNTNKPGSRPDPLSRKCPSAYNTKGEERYGREDPEAPNGGGAGNRGGRYRLQVQDIWKGLQSRLTVRQGCQYGVTTSPEKGTQAIERRKIVPQAEQ